jgi:UDP-N-acetylmuramoylalanine--D-glutamate ligase
MDWKGKRVVIVGAARQGTALAAYLVNHGAQVVLTDSRSEHELQPAIERLAGLPIEWRLGGHSLRMLDNVDLLALSGGVPSDIALVTEGKKRQIPVVNDSQIFMDLTPAKVIGVTGSAGKTTTTTLLGRILKAMEGKGLRQVWVGGNIGNPLIADVDGMQSKDLAVMELSSFQLEWMTKVPQVALILNIAPNHLDRHATMENYVAAKARILDFQNGEDVAILNREDPSCWELAAHVKGKLISFGRGELADGQLGTFVRGDQIWLRDDKGEREILPVSAIELRGEHNLMNVLAAVAAAAAVGAMPDAMLAGVRGFRGAPHRLEWVRSVNGVDWYNDSIATAPQRAIAALNSFERPVILMLGGRDKGLPWEDLARLAKDSAKHVVLFGEASAMLKPLFTEFAPNLGLSQTKNLNEAIQAAAVVATSGEVVLLAPGGTSFDEFVDFEARGERFRELVNQL